MEPLRPVGSRVKSPWRPRADRLALTRQVGPPELNATPVPAVVRGGDAAGSRPIPSGHAKAFPNTGKYSNLG